ncbi:MAG: phage holin family protein [Planctomycetales bacterium]
MAHQETLNRGNGRSTGEHARGVSDLAHDLAEMAELQWRLFSLDLREGAAKAPLPVGLAIGGIWFVLATVPLLLTALAWSLIDFADMRATWAYLISVGAGAAIGGGMFLGAWLGFRRSIAPFQRSREEFARNFRWLKRTLRRRTAAETTPATSAGRRPR